MSTLTGRAIHFGAFNVSRQVFYKSRLSYALVNLKPLLPGHVLVCPLRVVPRYNDLTSEEVQDLALTVQRVSRTIERVFKATSLNIAIQDGADAGQSVAHVHTHVIPRHKQDLDANGGTDAIYDMMDGDEGDIGKHLSEQELLKGDRSVDRQKFRKPDVGDQREARSVEEMEEEARMLAEEMERDQR